MLDDSIPTVYEVSKHNALLFVTVKNNIVIGMDSPSHGCFRSKSIGEPWPKVRKEYEDHGFLVHVGN